MAARAVLMLIVLEQLALGCASSNLIPVTCAINEFHSHPCY